MSNQVLVEENFGISENLANIDPKEIMSIFNILNGKPDSTMRVFPRDVKVEMGDLHVLNEQMTEKFKHYSLLGLIATISVRFENNTVKEFSNWHQFDNYNWVSSKAIDNITLKWDFMINFKGYEVPQRHTTVVRISAGMKPEQVLQLILTGQIEEMDSIDKNIVPVMCKVDFVNHLLGDEIINIVDEWNKGLQVAAEINDTCKMLRKYRHNIASSIQFVTPVLTIAMLASVFNLLLARMNIGVMKDFTVKNIQTITLYMAGALITYKGLKRFGLRLARNTYQSLMGYGEIHTFHITKGDENKQDLITKANRRHLKGVTSNLIMSVLTNIICGVLASYIFAILH